MQRVRGSGVVTARLRAARTHLHRLGQEGSAKIRLPSRPEGDALEAVLINTAGGLTGGDQLDWRVETAAGSHTVVTTQACEKVYRSADGWAQVTAELVVGPGAALAWLPQETILFEGGCINRRLEADVAEDGVLLVMEALVLGRTAMGERLTTGGFRDRWRIRRNGRLVFADDIRIDGGIQALINAPPTLAGGVALASLLLLDATAEQRLSAVRDALGPFGGASAFDSKLVVRVAAPDGLTLRRTLLRVLAALSPNVRLPRVWTF